MDAQLTLRLPGPGLPKASTTCNSPAIRSFTTPVAVCGETATRAGRAGPISTEAHVGVEPRSAQTVMVSARSSWRTRSSVEPAPLGPRRSISLSWMCDAHHNPDGTPVTSDPVMNDTPPMRRTS